MSKKSTNDSERNHIWEVRHAGLLGIKYEVAVRSDIFDSAGDIKQEDGGLLPNQEAKDVLRDVVDVAILGYAEILWLVSCSLIFFSRLGDRDDDVRSVAATCLLPVAQHLVDYLPESLERILVVLWHCLGDMKDDLSSSVGAVMDLLGISLALSKPEYCTDRRPQESWLHTKELLIFSLVKQLRTPSHSSRDLLLELKYD